jgi:hypothetical protein
MLTKEEIRQALHTNLKNNNWDVNPSFSIHKEEAEIILDILDKEYDDRFNELHG